MLASHSGSFFCYVPKTPSFFSSLLGAKSAVEQAVSERLEKYVEATTRRSPVAAASRQQLQKFIYPGGGLTVQPGVQAITEELVRVTPYVQQSADRVVVFFGSLSNLKDLWARRREYARAGVGLREDAGTGPLTTACLLELYNHFDNGRELMMLSELQGQYAFVLYDSTKNQVFAARDPSGGEHLYYRIDEDGGVSWTNSLDDLPAREQDRSAWKELKPGHYMLGKVVAQFALSLRQLEKRERKESVDADALAAMLRRESHEAEEQGEKVGGGGGGSGFGAVRALLRNRSKD